MSQRSMSVFTVSLMLCGSQSRVHKCISQKVNEGCMISKCPSGEALAILSTQVS